MKLAQQTMSSTICLDVETEVAIRIVEANIRDKLRKGFEVVWQLPFLRLVAYKIAENAAEIFVARKGKERAGVGEHPNKTREQAAVGKGV